MLQPLPSFFLSLWRNHGVAWAGSARSERGRHVGVTEPVRYEARVRPLVSSERGVHVLETTHSVYRRIELVHEVGAIH